MIQQLLTKYGVAFHVAVMGILACCLVFAGRAYSGYPYVWLSAIALELALLLPSVLRDENFSDARRRTRHAFCWDPMLYIGLISLAFVLAQGINGGCELVYQQDVDVWKMGDPRFPWMPFAVDGGCAYRFAGVLLAVVVSLLAVRDFMSRSAKRCLLQLLTGGCGAVAWWFVFRYFRPASDAWKFLDSVTVQSVGFAFGFMALIGLGLYADRSYQSPFGRRLLLAFAVFGNLFGMLFAASPLVAALGSLLFLLLLVLLLIKVPGFLGIEHAVSSIIVLGGFIGLVGWVWPENPLMHKIAALGDFAALGHWFSEIRPHRAKVALSIFTEHPWFGVGVYGFGSFVGMYVKSNADWAFFKQDQGWIFNDYLQLLVEGGGAGVIFSIAALVVLIIPIGSRLRDYFLVVVHGENKALSSNVFAGLLALLFAFMSAWLGNVFQLPAVLLATGCAVAALPAFIPAASLRRNTVKSEHHSHHREA